LILAILQGILEAFTWCTFDLWEEKRQARKANKKRKKKAEELK
jgi:hypothetical protein